MSGSQIVTVGETANRILVFDEVHPLRAAEEQADKKRLNAFGLLAKLNPLNRPKEATVRSGVIEVDGLTGEVIENGQWFKDKWNQLATRDMLIDLGAELAGSLVPGGNVAVKVIGRLTE